MCQVDKNAVIHLAGDGAGQQRGAHALFGPLSLSRVSKSIKTAAGMSGAVVFVITVASALTSVLYTGVLVPLRLVYMETVVFILVIAALVQVVEMVLKKLSRGLYAALGVYLPLITTNCAVLGVALTNVQDGNDFLASVVSGLGTALGFGVAIILLAGIRQKMSLNNVPHEFSGMPITLITAGLMAMAFYGFSGLGVGG